MVRELKGKPSLMIIMQTASILGGTQSWFDFIRRALDECGWEVHVALPNGKFNDGRAFSAHYAIENPIYIESKSNTRNGRVLAIRNVIKRAAPHIVMPIYVGDAFSAMRTVKAVERGAPRLFVPLHVEDECLLKDIKRNSDIIDRVVTPSARLRQILVDNSQIDSMRLGYAPCGVPVPADPPAQRFNNGWIRIGVCGRLTNTHKRILDVIEIVRQLELTRSDFEIVIAGDGEDRSRLVATLNEIIGANRVNFLGQLDPSKLVSDFYEKIDLLLITSDRETGPLTAWEAMARGVIVCSSDFLGRKEEAALIDQFNCVLFPIGDNKIAAAKLNDLINGIIECGGPIELANNGWRTVLQKYNIESSKSAWISEINKALMMPTIDRPQESFEWGYYGRLDRLLGPERADQVRRYLRRRSCRVPFTVNSATAEWPVVSTDFN